MGWSPGPGATSGADVYIGTDGDDVADGLAGDDRLTGGLGADRLTGGTGADTFVYLAVADSPYAPGAGDHINDFATGVDRIDLSAATGSGGGVAINRSGGFSSVFFQGASGPAGQIGVSGHVNGSDIVSDASTVFYITGDSGGDVIYGSNGVDYINGGAGDDNILGGFGADILTGGSGMDNFYYQFVAQSTAFATDIITDFTSGLDRIALNDAIGSGGYIAINRSGSRSTVYFQRGDGFGGAGQIAVYGTVQGSDFYTGVSIKVYITGDDGNDVLRGGSNFDYLIGGGGDDVLSGGQGADVLVGGSGADTFLFVDSPDRESLIGQGDQIADFTSGEDILNLDQALHSYGGSSVVALNRSGNLTTIYYKSDTNAGGTGQITAYGVVQATDMIVGANIRFYITADGGDDILKGSAGYDDIRGGGGNDAITGGGAGDLLTGGAGSDTFYYTALSDSTAAARDTIYDFSTGVDRLDILALGGGVANIAFDGANTVFTFTSTAGGTPLSLFAYGQIRASDVAAAGGVTFTGNGAPSDGGVEEHAVSLVGYVPNAHADFAMAS